jgi:hypothetical protein
VTNSKKLLKNGVRKANTQSIDVQIDMKKPPRALKLALALAPNKVWGTATQMKIAQLGGKWRTGDGFDAFPRLLASPDLQ